MIETPGVLLTIVAFVAVIGPLIFIHEMGHYLAGRMFGVHAEAFSIGFGREMLGWTDRRGTRWKIALLPLGGYVKFAGDMSPASQPTAEWLALPAAERNRTFQAKPVWQKAIIVAAGPAVNFLFAILVFIAIFATYGQVRTPPVVTLITANSAAARAGFAVGDRVTTIDGTAIERFEDIVEYVILRPNEAIRVEVLRGGRTLELPTTLGAVTERDRFGNTFRIGRIGFGADGREIVRLGPLQLVGAATGQVADAVTSTVQAIGQIITGRRPVEELGGPLSIAKFAGQQATLGCFQLLWFMTAISINLGFINLLPVPVLDGGHLFFYAVEAVRRRPVSLRAQDYAFRAGVAAILALMVFVTINDLGSLGLWRGIAGLIG